MSTKEKIKEMKELFSVFEDPMDKYTQIIELGKKNNGLDKIDKNNQNRIYGCASLAWVKTLKNKHFYSIQTDSDTFIVKGLLNVLQYVIGESTKEDIFQLDIQNILENMGLGQSITSQRTNGFLSALDKVKEQINFYE